jgi:hypothetical protein
VPKRVLFEEVDYVYFGGLTTARLADVVGHQQDHELFEGEGVMGFVALG